MKNDTSSNFMIRKNISDATDITPLPKDIKIDIEDVNAILAKTDNGKTIILCDYNFTSPPDVIIVNLNTSLLSIVGGDFGTAGIELQYPIESVNMDIWKREAVTYFAHVNDGGSEKLYEVPVCLTNI